MEWLSFVKINSWFHVKMAIATFKLYGLLLTPSLQYAGFHTGFCLGREKYSRGSVGAVPPDTKGYMHSWTTFVTIFWWFTTHYKLVYFGSRLILCLVCVLYTQYQGKVGLIWGGGDSRAPFPPLCMKPWYGTGSLACQTPPTASKGRGSR